MHPIVEILEGPNNIALGSDYAGVCSDDLQDTTDTIENLQKRSKKLRSISRIVISSTLYDDAKYVVDDMM